MALLHLLVLCTENFRTCGTVESHHPNTRDWQSKLCFFIHVSKQGVYKVFWDCEKAVSYLYDSNQWIQNYVFGFVGSNQHSIKAVSWLFDSKQRLKISLPGILFETETKKCLERLISLSISAWRLLYRFQKRSSPPLQLPYQANRQYHRFLQSLDFLDFSLYFSSVVFASC